MRVRNPELGIMTINAIFLPVVPPLTPILTYGTWDVIRKLSPILPHRYPFLEVGLKYRCFFLSNATPHIAFLTPVLVHPEHAV